MNVERTFFHNRINRGKNEKDVVVRRGNTTPREIKYERLKEKEFSYGTLYFFGEKLLKMLESKGTSSSDYFEKKIQEEKNCLKKYLYDLIKNKPAITKMKNSERMLFEELKSSLFYCFQKNPNLFSFDLFNSDKSEIVEVEDDFDFAEFLEKKYKEELEKNPDITLLEVQEKIVLEGNIDMFLEFISDDDRLVKFLSAHKEKFEKESAIFVQDRLPGIEQKSRERLMELSVKGFIPFDEVEIKKRLENIIVEPRDSFLGYMEETGGTYDYHTKIVSVSLSENFLDEDYIDILVHEYLHAISGKQYTIRERQRDLVTAEKKGATFEKMEADWLDEALTEGLSIKSKLVEEDFSQGSHVFERKILGYLYGLGLDERKTLDMYFESYGDSFNIDGNKHMLPNTREFFRHVNNLFGRGVFLKLHKVILFIEGKEDGEYYKLMDAFISGLSQIEKPIQLSEFLNAYNYLLEN